MPHTYAQSHHRERRPLAWGIAASMLLHAVGIPAALLFVGGGPAGPTGRDRIRLSVEQPPEPEKPRPEPEEQVIYDPGEPEGGGREPAPAEAEVPELPDLAREDPMPDLEITHERAPVVAVAVKIPKGRPADTGGSTGDTGGSGGGTGGGTGSGTGEGTGAGGAQAAADAAALPPPAAEPQFPDSPPEEMLKSLPDGLFRTRTTDVLFEPDEREELVRRIYVQKSYPDEALDLSLEGVVVVRFDLDASGRPQTVEVANPGEADPLLQQEAIEMVRRGGPYPLPTVRREVELFVAVAWLNTADVPAMQTVLVRSTGIPLVDDFAVALSVRDAVSRGTPGWNVSAYHVRATLDARPGQPRVELVGCEGDERFRKFLENQAAALFPPPESSGFLRVPIRFKLLDR